MKSSNHLSRSLAVAVILALPLTAQVANAGRVCAPFSPGTGNWTLVTDGDFESPTTAWSCVPYPLRGQFVRSSNAAAVGSFSAEAVAASTFTGAGFCWGQSVATTPGATYVLSAFLDASALSVGKIRVDVQTPPGGTLGPGIYLESGNAGWQFVWWTFTAPHNSVVVRLVRDGSVVFGEPSFVDEVAVTPAAQFAPPSGQPLNPVLPGSGGDLELTGGVVGGPALPTCGGLVYSITGNDLFYLTATSPQGTYVGQPLVLVLELAAPGQLFPGFVWGIPGLHVNPSQIAILLDGISPWGGLPAPVITPGGMSLGFRMPPALIGTDVRFQGVILLPSLVFSNAVDFEVR